VPAGPGVIGETDGVQMYMHSSIQTRVNSVSQSPSAGRAQTCLRLCKRGGPASGAVLFGIARDGMGNDYGL
jgi:hypothetical protein